jgi:hypothetical protein
MHRFNVGDRVRYTGPVRQIREWGSESSEELRAGMIGTVKSGKSTFPYISWDSITCGHSGSQKDPRDKSQWAVPCMDLELI